MENNSIAYHYTTLDGLYGIITSKSLLLTSLHAMNDPIEGGYTPERFLEDFNKIEYPDEKKSFFKTLLNKIDEDRNKFFELCKKDSEAYSICFSSKEDSLSHWERYAEDLTGVCISFDLDELQTQSFPLFNEFSIREIIYSDEDRSKTIGSAVVNMYNEMFNYLSKKDKNLAKNNFFEILTKNSRSHLAAIYLSMIYFIKNEYWNEENEIRLLYDDSNWKENLNLIRKIKEEDGIDLENEYIQNHEDLGLNKKEFEKLTSIRACRRLSLDRICNEKLIPEIKIGSKSSQTIADLRAFLDENKLEGTKITESKIKIR